MLVFERLASQASPRDRLSLYASKIEGSFATIFRQAAMFRFEQRCHRKRRESGELTAREFAEIWQDELQSMFGDSLKLGEQHGSWWSYVSHFIAAPFYVYAYAFGDCLVNALYGVYREGGDPDFPRKYLDLLRAGGTLRHKELLAPFGLDASDPAFWNKGLDVISGFIDELERDA